MNRAYQHHLVAGPGKSADVNRGRAVKRGQTTRQQTEAQEPGRRTTSGEPHSSPWPGLLITVVPWLVLFGVLVGLYLTAVGGE